MATYTDVFFDNVVCVSAAKESAEEVATARRNIEQRALEGTGEVESRVEHVTNGCEERVHVPD
jgi:hypothetical protein